jgi:Rab5 GDP/GTP exchange factor
MNSREINFGQDQRSQAVLANGNDTDKENQHPGPANSTPHLTAPKMSLLDDDDPEQEITKSTSDLTKLILPIEPLPSPLQTKELPASPTAPEPPAEDEKPYLDPTPKTPVLSRMPSDQSVRKEDYNERNYEYGSEDPSKALPERPTVDMERDDASEIQSIMDQFADEAGAPTKEEIMSPRQELSTPILGFPPRKSSLEPLRSRDMDSIASSPVTTTSELRSASPPPVPPKPDQPFIKSPPAQSLRSPSTSSAPPPPPEPEPDLPFDFHRFLEQLRHKSADPVAKFLRSFLTEFGKKQWMVHEQVKIISDFLAFITNKMALCDVWREVSDAEFDNAKEGMEKLIMNRLYAQTFSPAIPPPVQPPRSTSRGKRKEQDRILGPGRRGQHQEDIERDDILAQKIRIYGWVKEEHLDIPPVGANSERFLKLAQQELLKIKNYRAPRDKVICVLNCCKVIFGLLKNAKSADTSADSFVPLLIYTVLHANPDHLVSNVQYILRFRNQDKLGGESGYYLSSLSGAIQFIESLDRTTLTVSDDEFEKNVELAVSEIAEQNRETEVRNSRPQGFSEKSSLAQPELTPRNSQDTTSYSPGKGRPDGSNGNYSSGSYTDDNDAVTGLLRTIQRPLSTIGRIFSDQDSKVERREGTSSAPPEGARLNPSVFQPPRKSNEEPRISEKSRPTEHGSQERANDAQEAAARQASAEAAEARRIQRAEHRNVVETLFGMFPNLDKDVIEDVVKAKEGRVGLAVDACLALTAGG